MTMTFPKSKRAVALLTTAMTFVGMPSYALEATFGLKQSGVYDTNPLMSNTDTILLWGETTSPDITISSKTPTSALSEKLIIDANRFNKASFNSVDAHSTFGYETRSPEWTLRLGQRIDYDTTRVSELTNKGRNVGTDRHTRFSIDPSLTYKPSDLDEIALNGTASMTRYTGTTHTNYNVFGINPSWFHTLTPMHASIASVDIQRYKTTEGPAYTGDSIASTLGWNTAFTPNFSVRGQFGRQAAREKHETSDDHKWSWSNVYSATLMYHGEQDSIDLLVKRAQQPLSDGNEALLTTYSLSYQRKLLNNVSFHSGLSYQKATYEQPESDDMKILAKANAGLSYSITPEFETSFSYRHSFESFMGNNGHARGNWMMLSLSYRPLSH